MKPFLERFLRAAFYSVLLVGILVGNAHMTLDVGWPTLIQGFGLFLLYVSFVFAILPALPLLLVEFMGVHLPFVGRESFIVRNLWLWIYCTVIYTIAFYFLIPVVRRLNATVREFSRTPTPTFACSKCKRTFPSEFWFKEPGLCFECSKKEPIKNQE